MRVHLWRDDSCMMHYLFLFLKSLNHFRYSLVHHRDLYLQVSVQTLDRIDLKQNLLRRKVVWFVTEIGGFLFSKHVHNRHSIL